MEALRLAARSGFFLMKCDALNLLVRLLRKAGCPVDAKTVTEQSKLRSVKALLKKANKDQ